MDSASITLLVCCLAALLFLAVFLVRCLTQGKTCLTRNRIDDRTVLITAADTVVGIELTKVITNM